MLFSDKLVFLMELTGTSNLALAAAIHANPAQISLMRTGRRGQPQKAERLRRIAEYFAEKCAGDSQRRALADIMDQQQIKLMQEPSQLINALYRWISSSKDFPGGRAEQFLHEMNGIAIQSENASEDIVQAFSLTYAQRDDGRYSLYYGNDGRRAALGEFLRFLHTLDKPCEVIIASEESFEWLLESPAFAREITEQMLALADRGFSCRRIAAPLLSANAAFDSLSRWLPLYMTGQVYSYYYPRLRDDLYRSTIYAVPGKMALASISIGPQTRIDATMLVTDQSIVEVLTRRFEAYFERCLPMATTYDTFKNAPGLHDYLLRFEGCQGTCVRRSCSFSAITTPPELLNRIFASGDECAEHRKGIFMKARALFENNIAEYCCVDILRLASAEDIIAGKVPISLSYILNGDPIFYTIEEYILHLRYLLELLERWENYVVVLEENSVDANAIYVKERQSAALIRTQPPFTVFEIAEPNTIAACLDYLHRITDASLKRPAWKQRVVFQIRQAIRQLEQQL